MDWLRIESPAYWTVFTAAFLLVSLWESAQPCRDNLVPASRRWRQHGLLLVILAAAGTAVFRISPVAAATVAQGSPWGVLALPAIPYPLRFAVGFLLLDFTKWGTHWLFHHVAFLWPIHRVHHSDPDFEVSTGARFHPLEPWLAQVIDLGWILALAPPPAAILCGKLAGVASNFFEHANAALPASLERVLRRLLITPDLHRIHHSQGLREQNRNFGEVFSLWDRIFGTYLPEGPPGMKIGLKGYDTARSLELREMLTQPFQKERG